MEQLANLIIKILNLEINFFGVNLKPLYLVVLGFVLVFFKILFPSKE